MIERLAQRLTKFSVTRPWLVVVLFLLVFAAGAGAARKLEMRLNYMELLPDDSPEVVDLKWVMKKAGTEGFLVAVLSGGTREERAAFAPELARAVESVPEIRYAEYRNEVAFFRKHAGALLPLDEVKRIRTQLDEKVRAGVEKSFDLGLEDEEPASKVDDSELERAFADIDKQLPPELLEDPKGTELYVLAKPGLASLGVEQVNALLASVETATGAAVARSGKAFKVELGGPAVFMKRFNEGVQADLGVISVVALVAAVSLLLFATRRPLAAIFILVPIAGAITCSLGIAAFTIGHLNIISSLLVAILLGLGVEFGIHLILRTNEARHHLPVNEALLEAVPETMDGAFSGAVTNAAAFIVLLFASFSAYRQFGFIAAVGIFLSWLFTYTLVPALVALTERFLPGWVIRANEGREKTFDPPRWVAWSVVVALPLIALAGAWALPRVGLERSFNALNGDAIPDPVGQRAGVAMGTTLTPAFLWVKSVDDARKVEAIFERLKKEDPNPNGSIIQGTVSLAKVLHEDWDERQPELDRIRKNLRRFPDDVWKKYEARLTEFEEAVSGPKLALADIPETFRRKFTPLDGDGTFVLYSPSRSVDDARELDDFVDKLELAVDRAKAEGVETRVMSENRIAVHIFRQVFADAPFIAWAATLVALGVLFLLLRNVKETLFVFSPLAFGMLMMVLGMYLTGTKLNFMNMCVIPSIFTVAIDNTVHLYHRYAKEGRRAMPAILANTGLAVLMASLVNAAGYAPMLLANFYGMKSLGIVASFGMLGMVLATVAWFPALLLLLPERLVHRREGDPVSEAPASSEEETDPALNPMNG